MSFSLAANKTALRKMLKRVLFSLYFPCKEEVHSLVHLSQSPRFQYIVWSYTTASNGWVNQIRGYSILRYSITWITLKTIFRNNGLDRVHIKGTTLRPWQGSHYVKARGKVLMESHHWDSESDCESGNISSPSESMQDV